MKTHFILCTALLLGSASVLAQGPPSARPLFDLRKKKVSEETKNKAMEAATTLYKAVPDEIKNKAKDMLNTPEAAAARQKALEAAQSAMRSPQSTETPAETPAPAASTSPATPVAESPPPPAGPQARPLQPLDLDEAPAATKGQIVITAQKSAFFDANRGYGVYNGAVKARHPQMYIECEELQLFMSKQEGGPLTPAPRPGPAAAKDSDILAPAKKSNEGSAIEKAEARGPMVTVEKLSETGELQIGHCKHLIYDGKTGNTTLLEWPQVQAGNKLHKATEPGCVMVIDQKGLLTTTGGHQTIILQGEDAVPKSRSGMGQ